MTTIHLREVRIAVHSGEASQFIDAITDCNIDDALQQLASGMSLLLETHSEETEDQVESFISKLTSRNDPGDSELAEDLRDRLHGEPLRGRALSVDLELFTEIFEGDPNFMEGGYLDVDTGDVVPLDVTDPMIVGEDSAINVDADPDRYLWFDRLGGRDGWQDMADFAQRQPDTQMRERLEQSIRGKGAFRAFGTLIFDTELEELWNIFSTDRRLGRARQRLAEEGIRAV